jgi:hypothetical protein
MAEYPMIFSGPMVRAILEGRKTQTRRVIKPQPVHIRNGWWEWGYKYGAPKASAPRTAHWHADTWQQQQGTAPIDEFAPFQSGDILWVRETWGLTEDIDGRRVVEYKAGGSRLVGPGPCIQDGKHRCLAVHPWRPSTRMPKWACRLRLRITDVRAQRLQDISEADAYAEAAPWISCDTYSAMHEHPREDFQVAWEKLNRKRGYGWGRNPWVWVIGFEKRRDK